MTGRMRTINIPIFVPHLGCPNDCVFCDQHKITMNAFVPNAERVRTLIEETLKYTDTLSTPVHRGRLLRMQLHGDRRGVKTRASVGGA